VLFLFLILHPFLLLHVILLLLHSPLLQFQCCSGLWRGIPNMRTSVVRASRITLVAVLRITL
jgi:hypothetical protein